jgi:ribosome-associated toxin RatA of RatAB toxin-antitoxin module
MHAAEIHGRVRAMSAEEVFDMIADFDRYQEYGESIRSVHVESSHGGVVISKWDVDFRGGHMKWTEEDTIDRSKLRIDFRQLEGSLRHFAGHWVVAPDGDDALIHFFGEFDLGMPSLASFIDRIAESTIRENLTSVLRGMFGDRFGLEPSAASAPA